VGYPTSSQIISKQSEQYHTEVHTNRGVRASAFYACARCVQSRGPEGLTRTCAEAVSLKRWHNEYCSNNLLLCHCLLITWLVTDSGRYQMFTAANVPFIYNQTTGQFWKFYVNPATEGKPAESGFQRGYLA